jgi:NAD(P)-dependent dehydrogenase (short-subunit alcohol dehydrogenase family)
MARIILVTGANRGIGREIARQLAEGGHKVILGIRSEDAGQRTAQEIGHGAAAIKLDVTSDDSVAAAAQWIEAEYGKLDAVVNNAGIGVGNAGLATPNLDEVRQIMEVNFYGPMRLNAALLPLLRKGDAPSIVNMSSGMGELKDLGLGGYAGYRLSKAGLNAQTLQLAGELSEDGIKVNAMCPGWVKTEMGRNRAPRHVSEGADTAVWLATDPSVPNGKFFRDREVIDW